MRSNHDSPAFPVHINVQVRTVEESERAIRGMPMREAYAKAALEAMDLQIAIAEPAAAIIARSCFLVADAMLKASES